MKLTTLSLASTALALPSWPSHGSNGPPHGPGGWPGHGQPPASGKASAAYFLDNDPSGSSIAALSIAEDGTLSNPVRTSTGGVGSISVNATDGAEFTVDSLGSQGTVVVSGDLLFTVNAGSDTVVMFKIDPEDPLHPHMVGEPASTQGQFPVSVAYSEELQTACISNGGAVAGISCFDVDMEHGLQAQGSLRALNSSIIDESTPPTGPPGSAGQILFDPQSKGVFTLIKGNPGTKPVELGSVVAYAIDESGTVSESAVISQFNNILLDFSGVWLSDTQLLITDPASGVDLLDLQSDLTFTEAIHTAISTQKAICWDVYDPDLNIAYAIDAGQNVIYEIDGSTGALSGNITIQTDGVAADAGLFDSALDVQTKTLYALTGGNGIVVAEVPSGEKVQYLDLSSFGNRQGYQGMALYYG